MSDIQNVYQLDNPIFNNAVDRIVMHIYHRKQTAQDKVYMFCGCAPRVGNTTLAISAAVNMAKSGWSTLLIDADMRKDARYKRMNRSKNNLASYLEHPGAELSALMQRTNHESLHYIAAGTAQSNPVQLLCAERMQALLAYARGKYDFIFIDVAAPVVVADACVLAPMVDDVALITAWDDTTSAQMRATQAELTAAGANIMGVVINRMDVRAYKRHNQDASYFVNKEYMQTKGLRLMRRKGGAEDGKPKGKS